MKIAVELNDDEYSKEFVDAYKERVKRVQNGEIFEYPIPFGYWPCIAMSATTVLGVEGMLKNTEDI